MDTKQVIVIRKDLKMRKGKMISQGAHASMKVFFDAMTDDWGYCDPEPDFILLLPDDHAEAMKAWMNGLFTKITCGADSLEQLEGIYEEAVEAGLPCAKITDAGLTEFGGVPTVTAIAIGPSWNDKIDPITKDLKLL